MAANLNNYYGIDFGTTSSAVVGYMVMDHKPEQFLYPKEKQSGIWTLSKFVAYVKELERG